MEASDQEKERSYIELLRKFHRENFALLEEDPGDFPAVQIMNLTGSVYMNHFLSLTLSICTNQISEELYKRYFMRELARFYSFYSRFKAFYQPGKQPEDLAGCYKNVLASFERYEVALSYVAAYFVQKDIRLVSTALTRGAAAVNEMTLAWQTFVRRDLASLEKKCEECGGKLLFADLECERCGSDVVYDEEELSLEFAALRLHLNEAGIDESSPFPLCIIEVYESYGRYEMGLLPVEHFVELLDWIMTQYEMARHNLGRQVVIEQDEYILERLYLILDGTEQVWKLLDRMRNILLYGENKKKIFSIWSPLLLNIKKIYKGYENSEEPEEEA